jgi:hypothetical protein
MAKESLKIRDQLSLNLAGATNPINSRGNEFTTVQEAIDDLEDAGVGGLVYVPVGTFNEALTITGDDITLLGSGWGTIINGGTTGHAINVSGSRCVVRELQCKTTVGGGQPFHGILWTGDFGMAFRVFVNGSDNNGISSQGQDNMISHCRIFDPDGNGIDVATNRSSICNTDIIQTGLFGIGTVASDTIINGNYIDTTGDDGINIHIDAENCVATANRITNWTNEAIDDDSGTSLVVTATDGDPLNDIT